MNDGSLSFDDRRDVDPEHAGRAGGDEPVFVDASLEDAGAPLEADRRGRHDATSRVDGPRRELERLANGHFRGCRRDDHARDAGRLRDEQGWRESEQ